MNQNDYISIPVGHDHRSRLVESDKGLLAAVDHQQYRKKFHFWSIDGV